HFLVGQDFVFARLIGVDDLAPQRQDGLVFPQAAAFRAAAGGVSLHQVQLALFHFAAGAIAQLARQASAGERAFALTDQLLLLAGGFTGLGGQQTFLKDDLGTLGILFQ